MIYTYSCDIYTKITHQNEAGYEGGGPGQGHVELGGQGVQEHGGCQKKPKLHFVTDAKINTVFTDR